MMVMVPGEGREDALEGKRVLVWTCETCARICGVGGREKAERTAEDLRSRGFDVVGVASTSASCLMPKAIRLSEGSPERDVVLALCCSIGAECARKATGKEVVNPVETLGAGYLDEGGVPRLSDI